MFHAFFLIYRQNQKDASESKFDSSLPEQDRLLPTVITSPPTITTPILNEPRAQGVTGQNVVPVMQFPEEQRVTRQMVQTAATPVPREREVMVENVMPVAGEQRVKVQIATTPVPREQRVNSQMVATAIPTEQGANRQNDTTYMYSDSPKLVANMDTSVTSDYFADLCVSGSSVSSGVATLMCASGIYSQTDQPPELCSSVTPQCPLGGSQGGTAAGGMLGGTGFLERRYDHPDFRYSQTPQKLMCGIYPVMLNGGGGAGY